jgi:hypothetical protein
MHIPSDWGKYTRNDSGPAKSQPGESTVHNSVFVKCSAESKNVRNSGNGGVKRQGVQLGSDECEGSERPKRKRARRNGKLCTGQDETGHENVEMVDTLGREEKLENFEKLEKLEKLEKIDKNDKNDKNDKTGKKPNEKQKMKFEKQRNSGEECVAGESGERSLTVPDKIDRNENDEVFACIKDAISRTMNLVPNVKNIELDTILSRIPYHQMLEDLFGGEEVLPEDVPIISRVYEEQYMRECMHPNEKMCVMGENCECMFIDPNSPFVAVEFILPHEYPTDQAQMCVLCSRKVTQQLFYDMAYKGYTFRGVIQRFGNICDQAGEYARQCMLICPPNQNVQCMPLPILSHQRNRYSVKICNGVKYLKQHRVYAVDFQ